MPNSSPEKSGCAFGCLGAIVGTVIGTTIVRHMTLDPDSTAWALLFYGTIPGVIVGAIVDMVYRHTRKK